ncbi:hypothetical protein MA03_02885 [Infirmifilum uzonense]|uniref:CRISPR-associated endonuclease Cas3 n=2 Tax=Infirmifilum uzonense TaxID=1550241 RepID=A0A0F7FGS2_9CREN|nr:hypothetical protein MA03_02885 [Infirmifilum uzonense]
MIPIEIYAYYKPPYYQTMREHVELALETFPEGSKLAVFGSSLTPSFHNALKIAIVLHDFGKTPFNIARAGDLHSGRELSFPGHELISGWIAYKSLLYNPRVPDVFGIPREELIENKLGELISLSVLLHHHPMDLKRRLEVFKRNLASLHVSKLDVEAFTYSLKGLLSTRLGIDEELFQNHLVSVLPGTEVSAGQIAQMAGQIFDQLTVAVWETGKPIHRKIFLLLLQGLVAADYCSARARGGGSLSVFSESMKVFVELYGGKCQAPST